MNDAVVVDAGATASVTMAFFLGMCFLRTPSLRETGPTLPGRVG